MDRKKFITTLTPLGIAAALPANAFSQANNNALNNRIPPYLQQGDIIGITCPAGYLTIDDAQPAINKLKEWGFAVKLGTTVGTRSNSFANTDANRLLDLQTMLDDTTVKAILCGRGGYGCNRIIDQVNFTNFVKKPKWIIGFSDITLLHTHINTQYNIATIHSKMCNSFPADWSVLEPLQIESINSIKDCLQGKKLTYTATTNTNNKLGNCTGQLVGGNLSIICSAQKTKSELNTVGKILFIEEVGEYLYSVDRMMSNLQRSGLLKNLKGLIVGAIKTKEEKPEEAFGETVVDIVQRVTKGYNYPICYEFPVGHVKVNYALKCNVPHQLTITNEGVVLKEITQK